MPQNSIRQFGKLSRRGVLEINFCLRASSEACAKIAQAGMQL